MLSEDALRAGVVACFTNAQELSNEATLLCEHAQSPRAGALTLMGAEEFAKAILFTIAALLPEHRRRLPCRLEGHLLKHHICAMAEVAHMMNSALWEMAGEFGGTTAMSRLGDLFGTLAEWGLDSLLNTETARGYYGELRRKHEIGGLAYLLEVYALLPTVVGDAQRWHDLAARVRCGLPDTRIRPRLPDEHGQRLSVSCGPGGRPRSHPLMDGSVHRTS